LSTQPLKYTWITGATSGLGKGMTLAFAKRGHALILTARRENVLKEVQQQALTIGSPDVIIMEMDMGDEASIESGFKKINAGGIIVERLVNNAGISQRSPALNTDMEVYRKIMEVDYFGVIHLTKLLLPQMVESKHGQFVVISSLVGKFATPLRSGYAAAKHALHGFFDALRAEHFEDNINVTIICPGFIHTDVSVNALTADGSKQNKMDNAQANGMNPMVFGEKACASILNKKNEVYIGGRETLGIYLNRYVPGLFRKIIRKTAVT